MSEPAGDSAPRGDSGAGGESGETVVSPPPAASSYRGVAITLAAALLLLAGLAGTAPFWAPSLPWAPPAVDPRVDRIEQALQQIRQDEAAAAAARQQLDRRVAALTAKPAAPAGDIAELRQQVTRLSTGNAELASRVAALAETAQSQQQKSADLRQRIATIDEAVQAQAKTSAELTARVETLEEARRTFASGSSGTAILLALLRIGDALAAGRPFAAEYDALTAAARDRPQVIAAAAPLAAPAKTGVAGRAALAARLRDLTPAIAKAAAPERRDAAAGWGGRLLDRLRGLVRVRRVIEEGGGAAGAAPGGAAAAVDVAEQALADGDLAAAVAAIEKLRDGAAEAARPWLDMAKERLAAERALQQLEAALTADLGGAATPPADGTSR